MLDVTQHKYIKYFIINDIVKLNFHIVKTFPIILMFLILSESCIQYIIINTNSKEESFNSIDVQIVQKLFDRVFFR